VNGDVVHVAGGRLVDGVWHDTHTDPVGEPILALLAELAARTTPPAVMLERDGHYPPPTELAGELAAIRAAVGGKQCDVAFPLWQQCDIAFPATPDQVRHDLAREQERLADALVGLTEPPPDFDADRVRIARTALTSKRAGAVARHAPAVAAALGDALGPLFADYASTTAKPAGDSAADVAAFVAYLRATGRLRGTRRHPRLRGR
jgi:uncharacterized protein